MARPVKPNKIEVEGNVVKILMSRGISSIIDLEDYPRVSGFRWFVGIGKTYVETSRNRKVIWLHRLINNTPKGMITDHINRDVLDNRKSNLRTVTHSQNSINQKRRSNSGYRGVHRSPNGLFKVSVQLSGKSVFVGYFKSAIMAAKAYDEAALKLHGKFAVLNFPISIIEEEPCS